MEDREVVRCYQVWVFCSPVRQSEPAGQASTELPATRQQHSVLGRQQHSKAPTVSVFSVARLTTDDLI